MILKKEGKWSNLVARVKRAKSKKIARQDTM